MIQDGSSNKAKDIGINYKVLIFIPNIIGYIRLSLLYAAFYHYGTPVTFLILYCSSIILDAFDGLVARKLNQTSWFGAWLDIFIDNLGRGLLWTHLHTYFYLISVVEWLTFVCNHKLGPNWKKEFGFSSQKSALQQHEECPTFISRIFCNNFYNLWGFLAIGGLHVLPVWMFAMQQNIFNKTSLSFLPMWTEFAGLIFFTLGRCICFIAEFWSIWAHVSTLLVRMPSTTE